MVDLKVMANLLVDLVILVNLLFEFELNASIKLVIVYGSRRYGDTHEFCKSAGGVEGLFKLMWFWTAFSGSSLVC